MNELELLELIMENIKEYSSDYMDTAIAGIVTVNLELYTLKEIQRAIEEAKEKP